MVFFVNRSLLVCVRGSLGPLSVSGLRNYHQSLRTPYQMAKDHYDLEVKIPLPETVSANMKNVVGWRGGAERGFLSVYPDCIQVLRTEGARSLHADLTTNYMKVFTQHLSSDVVGQRQGIVVPITYRQLKPKATKDEMKSAHILGWCVELVRAGCIVADKMCMPDESEGSKQVCNYNELLALDAGVFVILNKFFKGTSPAMHSNCVDSVLDAQQSAILGRALQMKLLHMNGGDKFKGFDFQNYKQLIRNTVTHVNLCLPVTLALHLANMSDPKIHTAAKSLLFDIGYFVHVSRDYYNCYVDQNYKDIKEGKMTWLIISARQRASFSQLATLEENYGRADDDSVAAIQQVYKELNVKKMINRHLNETRDDIHKQIQQISRVDEQFGLTQEFFFKILDNMNTRLS